MRNFFNGLVIGALFGAVGYWLVQSKFRPHPRQEQHFENSVALMHGSASNAFGYYSDGFTAKMEALDLLPRQIKEELADRGMIVRRTAHDIGESMVNAASDKRAVTALKGEYAADQDLSGWQIAISCTKGQVELSGMVSSPEDIGRAVLLALETDGVRDVISTLQVKNNGLAGAGP